jgi:hypothetical protein
MRKGQMICMKIDERKGKEEGKRTKKGGGVKTEER